MADISKTVAVIFEGVNNTGAALGGVSASLDRVGTEATESANKVGQLDNEVGQLASKDRQIEAVVNSFKALAAALVVKQFIDANVNAEQFLKTLELSTGSAEKAAAEYQFVSDTADRLGLELNSTAAAYAKFSAATQGSSLEGEGARVIFQAFAGTLAAVGASSDDVSGALVQLSQGISKGRFELEDLKSIADRFPGFFPKFAEALDKTTDELFQFISDGKLTGEEVLKFARVIQSGLDGVDFNGYINSLNRLQNAQTQLFVLLGQSGAFDIITKSIQGVTTVVVGAVSAFVLLADVAGSLAAALASGNFDLFGESVEAALEKAAKPVTIARDRFIQLNDAAKNAGTSGANAGTAIADGMEKGAQSATATEKQTKELDAALKALGIDPKQFKDPLDDILQAFDSLARNPAVTGSQFLSGFLLTLDKIKDGPEGLSALEQVVIGLDAAQKNGRLTTEEYTAALSALEQKTNGQWQSIERSTDATKKNEEALKKQEEQTRKAAEAADRLRLEYEKLASSERIAQIEANTAIAVAGIQAEADKAVAAFDSIGESINATADLLGKLFGSSVFDDPISAFDPRFQAVQKQIELENQRRADELLLQKKLVEAQIAEMQARTESFRNGGGLIKIDGAGLQPHLEAFMWEILKTIQVRVNRDGLGLLLGLT